jgi:hypothetical protein
MDAISCTAISIQSVSSHVKKFNRPKIILFSKYFFKMQYGHFFNLYEKHKYGKHKL